ncbi:MAG TPA: chemotaxis response regulator protein-glutamate methylesterase [Pseudolabrys sp.]|nr:chemotaxis response regulator protein-glutamate methylesterase [Pseudolabrys sp.]
MSLALAPAASTGPGRRIRVMVVDDAVVVRGFFARWVEAEPDFELVASLRTGRDAVSQLERTDPDVVVLDVEMPELDGIAALPLLLEKKRDLIVIMASTVTRRNAEISLRALSLGAADYIPKPSTDREVTASATFRGELVEKIRALGQRAKRFRNVPPREKPALTARTPVQPHPLHHHAEQAPITLRPMPLTQPRVLLIGSSTGGPQALNTLIAQIGSVIERVPVLVTQHMPPTFTAILAEHLARVGKCTVHEGRHGEEIHAGTVYLAPGGKHMTVARQESKPGKDGAMIAIDDGPLINFCKPSVDPMLSTAAAVWGPKALVLMLTGMGHDGLAGARTIVAAGGHVLAQDEATSVVWGMPGQVAHAGLCSAVLPLPEIGGKLTRMFAGERP